MKKFSHYVFETTHDGNTVFYNTVTKKLLPKTAPEQELSDNFFFEGQEEQAIRKKIFSVKETAQISIVPTWACNLRCTHCVVLNKLVKKDDSFYDIDKVCEFVQKFLKFYNHKNASISFVGGEPLLVAARLNKIIEKLKSICDVNFTFTITTNLSVDIDEEIQKLLDRLSSFAVSIDGDHFEHNLQRKPIDGDYDPFVKTILNIKKLIKLNFREKITVQAALRDEFATLDHKKRYYTNLLKLGIMPKRIIFGCIHPTNHKLEASKTFKQVMSQGKTVNDICCKFRLQHITIDKEDVLSDWYSGVKIGTIFDEMSIIEDQRKQLIVDSLSVLHDEKCKSCPVIGCCWGRCVNGMQYFDNPSNYCNQDLLIKTVQEKAKSGTLYYKEKQ